VRGILIGALCGACYSPTFGPGSRCDTECPGDLVCVDHVCTDSGRSDGGGVADGMTIDGPPGDVDGDGVLDGMDNCPSRANQDQHDEDADAIGDACDPCPHLRGDAVDSDSDGVGDACDPEPTIAKQRIKFFDPFLSDRTEWQYGTNTGRVGETLRFFGAESGAVLSVANGETSIVTSGTIAAVAPQTPHQMSLMFGVDANVKYYHYAEFWDSGPNTGEIAVTKANAGTYTSIDLRNFSGAVPTGAFSMRVDESVAAQTATLDATLGGLTYSIGGSTATAPALTTSMQIHLYLQDLDVRLDYFIVIETLP